MRALLDILNVYEDGEINTWVEADVEPPPADPQKLDDWAEEELFPHTGTGNDKGYSGYEVRIVECDDPALVDRTFRFGEI